MSIENRTVSKLARKIQKAEGARYTEALREAQKRTHIDILGDGGNGSITTAAAESWLPVISRLKPLGEYQWTIRNVGPGWNLFSIGDDYEEPEIVIHVSGPIAVSHLNVESPETCEVENLLPSESAIVEDALTDAYSIHVLRSLNAGPEVVALHLDLRGASEQERIDTIIEFVNTQVDVVSNDTFLKYLG